MNEKIVMRKLMVPFSCFARYYGDNVRKQRLARLIVRVSLIRYSKHDCYFEHFFGNRILFRCQV